MQGESSYIISNVYSSDFVFDKEISGFDFFRVEGITELNRFRYLGKVVEKVKFNEKQVFAHYTPSKYENYVIGFLPNGPREKEYKLDGLQIIYIGKRSLPPTTAGRKSLTDLLNKTKSYELRRTLWSAGNHSFYPKKRKNLNDIYTDCDLSMFRGPFFRYNVLQNGGIILSLDSSTHYIHSKPILNEIEKKGFQLEWFIEEIRRKKQQFEINRRTFLGIHFFYELYQNDVTIDDVDPRPISKILLPKTQVINGIECKTIADYLRARYHNHPEISKLNDIQPGLKGQGYTYAPQFLYQTVPIDEVPNTILNNETFFMDRQQSGRYRDNQRPAKVRYDIITDYYFRYSFSSIDLGPIKLSMNGPLRFPITNKLSIPKLIVNEVEPVNASKIESALKNGFFESPHIDRFYIFSIIDSQSTMYFYEMMKKYANENYSVKLPEKPIPLEKDIQKMKIQIENSLNINNGMENSFLLGIINEESSLHDYLTNICGEFKVPSKMVTRSVAQAVCAGTKFYLKSILASIFSRAGGIPWVLYDKLHYDCYTAVDIGRSMSEYWAMGIVYNKEGKFTIRQGKIHVGEDLDEQSIRYCITEANNYSPNSSSLIYLRDGDIFENEKKLFRHVIEPFTTYLNVAIVSIKKSVPYRIFRSNNKVFKPLSGDYYFLDDYTAVLCSAGIDEYQHGTPKPVVAEIIPIRGNIKSKDVIEDIFRLSYLNWGSPGRSYSVPVPIRLAHESAFELSMGIRRYGAPF